MVRSKLFLVLYLLPLVVYAADPAAAVNSVTAKVDAWVASALALGAGGIIDFALRLYPSTEPLDLLRAIGKLFIAIGTGLDKILPQNVKQVPPSDQK